LNEVAEYIKSPVLIVGNGKLAYSATVCLSQAAHEVTLCTKNKQEAIKELGIHFADLTQQHIKAANPGTIQVIDTMDSRLDYPLAIIITKEDLLEKKTIICQLEEALPANAIIAINTESIPLSILQQDRRYADRVIGVNWVEPAHTTFFLEIISNAITNKELVENLFYLSKKYWNKDPYIIPNDISIRAKMFAAMAREAFYLVQNGYASVEDIDRAGRNDAGYYLPFAGNFRYMDLMGTYSYGLVMKDLNRELSKDRCLPDFLKDIIAKGGTGMENGRGFYNYEKGDAEKWNERFRKFSYQISRIIDKYPFNYSEDHTDPKANNISIHEQNINF